MFVIIEATNSHILLRLKNKLKEFTRSELIERGRLLLNMGVHPNKNWGIEIPPPSMSKKNSQTIPRKTNVLKI